MSFAGASDDFTLASWYDVNQQCPGAAHLSSRLPCGRKQPGWPWEQLGSRSCWEQDSGLQESVLRVSGDIRVQACHPWLIFSSLTTESDVLWLILDWVSHPFSASTPEACVGGAAVSTLPCSAQHERIVQALSDISNLLETPSLLLFILSGTGWVTQLLSHLRGSGCSCRDPSLLRQHPLLPKRGVQLGLCTAPPKPGAGHTRLWVLLASPFPFKILVGKRSDSFFHVIPWQTSGFLELSTPRTHTYMYIYEICALKDTRNLSVMTDPEGSQMYSDIRASVRAWWRSVKEMQWVAGGCAQKTSPPARKKLRFLHFCRILNAQISIQWLLQRTRSSMLCFTNTVAASVSRRFPRAGFEIQLLRSSVCTGNVLPTSHQSRVKSWLDFWVLVQTFENVTSGLFSTGIFAFPRTACFLFASMALQRGAGAEETARFPPPVLSLALCPPPRGWTVG